MEGTRAMCACMWRDHTLQSFLGYNAPSPQNICPCNEMCRQVRTRQQAQDYEVLQVSDCR